jgi:hypothetical protein
MRKSKQTFYARILSQIVNNDLARVYVIIDEGNTFFWSITSQNRNSSQAKTSRSNDFLRSIRSILCLFLGNNHSTPIQKCWPSPYLLHGYKFGVNGNQGSRVRQLFKTKGFMLDQSRITISTVKVSYDPLLQKNEQKIAWLYLCHS